MTTATPDAATQKRLALDLLLDAWDRALAEGVAPELLATTAIFTALTDMVENHGPEAVADLMAGLPARIRGGVYARAKRHRLSHRLRPRAGPCGKR